MSIADKLTTIAENEQKVYDAVVQAEYDRFWDNYQGNGAIAARFVSAGWNNETFKPKYNIHPNGYLFQSSNITGDLVEILESLGIDIYWNKPNVSYVSYMFTQTKFTRIGHVDFVTCEKAVTLTGLFNNSPELVTIDKLSLRAKCTLLNAFNDCTSLENITIEGTIGYSGINFQWSPLTHDSLISIINALEDNSGSETYKTIVLGSDNLAKLTDDEKNIMESKHWNYS